ncbi:MULTISPECIES: NAD-dependent succinate-semialdehyde dehydrogenase [unclassified Rhodococcus (in: high G+C Gram-positive bacteria)]|uniref:NAD-dependent succinate-semialdehyde dehydrogenase n=1 Tax=unclassified Rhodococcus (in: high G+C Gram-positive bacteria) TaxID=192944 RepID=UPI0006F509A9|nr:MULTISPECIES: NAD-dependent succinate-semialdehyde dehydrogenase [unclassified Rhodococcus (in: high G+C Gram-positive bacteria)]KQU38449.1 NAD-dependent succinate-semialdehyde dehydrogenase [Rhodococcus sp. Leaf225]KQU39812.1 NAD-dependent succinate-semialdehyde dehydrogenase [Rhodococcus sp. Leaf258]
MTTTTTMRRTDLFIGGEWVDTADARIEVIDPSDGTVLDTVADGGIEDAIHAVDAAADALQAWSATPPRERAEILRRSYELMAERADTLAELISSENGKALADARAEVSYAAEFFRWYSEEAVRNIGSISLAPSGRNRIMVEHRPIGVCVLITPWNFPAAMATRKIAPALAAGCSVVLKPATLTPLTAYAIADILAEAGVPAGVVNVITTRNTGPVVSAMLQDPRVRLLSFTGSTEVGRVLLQQASGQVLKCAMELGGNAPLIVLEDADLEVALDGAMLAKMRNGGQACTAANRILVHRSRHDDFVAGLASRMSALTVGSGVDPATECGPLVDAKSVDKVHELVQEAIGRGATLVTGGELPGGPGFFYPPTVLTNVDPESDIVATEIFGPVAAITTFDNDDEAVRAANSSEYGLSAYVFGRDLSRALAVAGRLETGMVAVNRGLVSDPAAPFGGVKQSGLGREGAHEGMLEYTETQYTAVDW